MKKLLAAFLFVLSSDALAGGSVFLPGAGNSGGSGGGTASTLIDDIPCAADNYLRRNATDDGWACTVGSGASGDNLTIAGVAAADPKFIDSVELNVIRCTGAGVGGGDGSCTAAEDVVYRLVAASIDAAELNTDSVSADELNATGVEAELEAVMDLQDMQGAVTDAQVPDDITVALASIAVSSFSTVQINTDPADCQIANEVALGINSFGVATCTALTDSYIPNDITINRATDATSADDLTCTNCIGPTEISDLTLSTDTAGNFVAAITTSSPLSGGGVGAENQTYTLGVTDGAVTGDKFNANVAGGYLTKDTAATPDELDLDTEVVTDDECSVMRISAGIVNTDDIASIFHTSIARTVTRIWCETDTGTATINLLRDDGSTASMATADLVCDTTGEDACATGCSTTVVAAEDNIAAQEEIDLSVVSVASTPTRLSFCITWTKDDI